MKLKANFYDNFLLSIKMREMQFMFSKKTYEDVRVGVNEIVAVTLNEMKVWNFF